MNNASISPAVTEPSSTEMAPRKPSASRLRKIATILDAAEQHFAQSGFEGASLELIAQDAGFSRHNLLYYYPSKEALYQAVLDSVLDDWLGDLTTLSKEGDPAAQIQRYIHEKFAFSRARPSASQLFTKEMIAGAPFSRDVVHERIGPLLAANTAVFEHWAQLGLIRRVNFTQLMFLLWTSTQGYADHQAQFALLLGQPVTDTAHFAQAEALLTQMVYATLGLQATD